jgi:hypothetical protein
VVEFLVNDAQVAQRDGALLLIEPSD